MAIELVSFDLDGTLVDTAGEIVEAVQRALREHDLPCPPPVALERLIGHGAQALMRKVLAQLSSRRASHLPPIDDEAVLASFDRHYADTAGTIGRPYPDADAALSTLKAAGLKLACVTNKELRHTERVLQAQGWAQTFDLVIGGDSLPMKKPHPAVLLRVAERLTVRPAQAVHVGDSAIDVQAARDSGFAAWAVPYGYNAGQPIADAQPDRIVASLADVAVLVLESRAPGPAATAASMEDSR